MEGTMRYTFLLVAIVFAIAAHAVPPDRKDPSPKSQQEKKSPVLSGKWKHSTDGVYEFKPSLDGKFVRMTGVVFCATATWDGSDLIVTWNEQYTGEYRWTGKEFVGFYQSYGGGYKVKNSIVRMPDQ